MSFAFTAHAADKAKTKTVDCSTDSLEAEIAKLDPSVANVVEFTGDCAGLVTIQGQADLTLIGVDGASISGVYAPGDIPSSVTALEILDSRVRMENVTINSGHYGLFCTDRSTCTLRDVIVQGGHYGVAAQGQSALDIQGASQIQDSALWGVSAFGASRVNMTPNWDGGFDPAEPGPVVSGNGVGAWVMDGSFFRSDNVLFTANGTGIVAQRDVMIKVFSNESGLGVTDSSGTGIIVRQNSVAQVLVPVTGNGGAGIEIGQLSYLTAIPQFVNGNGGEDFACTDVTASSPFCPSLTSTIADLQARLDALEAEAGATLEQRVAGKTYAVKTTGHGVGGYNVGAEDLPITLFGLQRDFSVAEGTLALGGDGTYSIELALVILPAPMSVADGGESGLFVTGELQRIDIPINNGGTWSVDATTNEIVLTADGGVQRLQASPNGEVLTVISNDQRLVEGDPTITGFFNSFIADAVYIQLPE